MSLIVFASPRCGITARSTSSTGRSVLPSTRYSSTGKGLGSGAGAGVGAGLDDAAAGLAGVGAALGVAGEVDAALGLAGGFAGVGAPLGAAGGFVGIGAALGIVAGGPAGVGAALGATGGFAGAGTAAPACAARAVSGSCSASNPTNPHNVLAIGARSSPVINRSSSSPEAARTLVGSGGRLGISRSEERRVGK